MSSGANINCRDIVGKTPLMIAFRENRDDIIKKLMYAKANPLIKTRIGVNILKSSPEEYAELITQYVMV